MDNTKQASTVIHKSLKLNRDYLDETLGVGKSFDIIAKEFHFDDHKAACYCVNGFFMTNGIFLLVRNIGKEIINFAKNNPSFEPNNLAEYLNTHISFVQVSLEKDMSKALTQILAGPMVWFLEGYDVAVVVDTRVYPARSPSESEVERVVRGPRDAYTETLITNTALTRRRIRDPNLRMEISQIGERSKTDICISYIENLTNKDLVSRVKERLKTITTDGIPMAEQSLDEYLVNSRWSSRWNPYPLVRYTERPDIAANYLLQGHVVIFVDTTPEVIILPTTFFHHLHHPEDYHMRPAVGTYMRWMILLAILMSLFLPAVWLEFAMHPKFLPKWLWFIGPEKGSHHISLPWQLLFVEIGLDILRRAIINTPLALASAIGLIAGIVFGQLTVKVGLISSEALVYIALATIGSFATSSIELSNANRMTRIALLILVGFFHMYGLIAGILIWFIWMANVKTFGIPYLWPLFPFDWLGVKQILIRQPAPAEMYRPKILKTQDITKK
ncbi:spore germination protein [Fodinisporobacter ferrooxydans]|uniref:Spore germination protein n=1 Tax=Fodinisporobacter ferrooxydans TaxID=2901836 RepID=A0ABY4CPE5_9BACL|nr:spore germination protein [Alicyclobacillaceae bacterium MYW30-H2]